MNFPQQPSAWGTHLFKDLSSNILQNLFILESKIALARYISFTDYTMKAERSLVPHTL